MLLRLLLVLCCVFVCSSQASFVESGSITLNKTSAYCYYYKTNNAYFSDADTWMKATSDNLYAYASVYASSSLQIDKSSVALGKCRPHDETNRTCDTSTDNTFTYISYDTEYVLVCLECHYWFGDCIIDDYTTELVESPQQGEIPCSICS